MKKVVIILSVVMFLSSNVFSTTSNNDIKLVLSEIVKFPANVELNCANNIALISFDVDQEGYIRVTEINACIELKKYILKQIDGYKLINCCGIANNSYQFKLKFTK